MRRALTAALVAVLVQACSAGRPAPAPPQELPSATRMLEALSDRRARLVGIRSLARLRYRSPTGSENARNVLAVQRPDRLRIEVLSVLGSVMVLSSHGGDFAAYLPRESTLYRGTASARNLAAYLPVDISIPAIVDHILATPPLLSGWPTAVDWDEGLIRLTQRDDHGTRVARFRDPSTLATYQEVDLQGHTTIEASYDDIDDTGALPLATRVTVRFPATSESLEISMRHPELNPTLPANYFVLSPPPETRQVDLDSAPL